MGTGDFFVAARRRRSPSTRPSDAVLYWVTDEPLLRYLGVAPTEPRFRATQFPADAGAELAAIARIPHASDRNR